MTKYIPFYLSVIYVFTFFFPVAEHSSTYSAERVLVVGDSITGHSMNLPYGFTHEIRNAFTESQKDVEFVPLGGSGQTIFSWRNIISNSYKNNQRLDIDGIFVKDEFDKGADVILVHLGMNDALQPSIKSTEEGYASWKSEYVALVSDIRARVPSVKKIVLTTPTMLTEDFDSFKNIMMDRLGSIINEVAQENDCEFVDTRQLFKDFVKSVRFSRPDFRFTLDFVHPNQFGHQVMSYSFLKGLGFNDVAQKYYDEKIDAQIKDFESPGFILSVSPQIGSSFDIDSLRIELEGTVRGIQNLTEKSIQIVSADGLKLQNVLISNQSSFSISFSCSSADLPTSVAVKINDIERSILINAPYFVTTGYELNDGAQYSTPENFPRDKAVSVIDDLVLQGKDPLKETSRIATNDNTVVWNIYFPSQFKTGSTNPNAVDIASIAPANAFDGAYVVRFIRSKSEQGATLNLNSEGFSTTAIEKIYLNGEEIYFDCLSPRHKKSKDAVKIRLKEGLNILVTRVDHTFWQWATSLAVDDAEGISF